TRVRPSWQHVDQAGDPPHRRERAAAQRAADERPKLHADAVPAVLPQHARGIVVHATEAQALRPAIEHSIGRPVVPIPWAPDAPGVDEVEGCRIERDVALERAQNVTARRDRHRAGHVGVPGEAQAHLRVALADAEVLPVELATGPEAHERIARGRMDTEDGALRVQLAGQAREVVTASLRPHRLRPPTGLPGHGHARAARAGRDALGGTDDATGRRSDARGDYDDVLRARDSARTSPRSTRASPGAWGSRWPCGSAGRARAGRRARLALSSGSPIPGPWRSATPPRRARVSNPAT